MAIYPDLQGKTVLVTGGASGIGAALVRAFAEQGSRVGFLDRDVEAGEALMQALTAEGRHVLFVPVDLRHIEALRAGVEKVRETFGGITVLVNNAAHDERHAAEDVTEEYFDERMDTNFKHQFFASQAVFSDMKSGGGSIICMSSITWMAGFGGMPLYTAAKSAVIGLVRSLARDFGPFDIRVNAITPGWIMTRRQLELWLTPEADAMRAERQALKRRLQPEDVAKLALFLASDDASGITSQNYVVDGGWV
ncbi:NAD(P)-dependent dehydrogenase (short-subunit alcohol dehydrogenase family) [Rhizobium soli]|uniref:NAD(P)-dependent dehydrogenase (Short-subunit alcohol dehydrogenase family) n=1 Tax=Rhizobium soli TaxID=424798 RepID=A0A7X0JQH2_9HYPH|nr:SDR family oxidoreductase [Rhizobium soli]MBB6511062.1 NAD(P)-dependent dehydrogenase (short-subunit alcohol dehydrogenase family) [Rhizobium soli]